MAGLGHQLSRVVHTDMLLSEALVISAKVDVTSAHRKSIDLEKTPKECYRSSRGKP